MLIFCIYASLSWPRTLFNKYSRMVLTPSAIEPYQIMWNICLKQLILAATIHQQFTMPINHDSQSLIKRIECGRAGQTVPVLGSAVPSQCSGDFTPYSRDNVAHHILSHWRLYQRRERQIHQVAAHWRTLPALHHFWRSLCGDCRSIQGSFRAWPARRAGRRSVHLIKRRGLAGGGLRPAFR